MTHIKDLICFSAVLCSILNFSRVLGDDPKIVIVGAGASGIAAASKLLENGLNDVTILEAENRIGGRVYTTKFGDYVVDLGGQWVHGDKGNVVYEMAWPMGLIEHANNKSQSMQFFPSDGSNMLTKEQAANISKFYFEMDDDRSKYLDPSKIETSGDIMKKMFNEYLKDHPDIEQHKTILLNFFELLDMSMESSMSWDDVSATLDDFILEGDWMMNWKEKGYSTILDILMKKFPDPTKELPVMEKTKLDTEVEKIDYSNPDGKIKVHTKNGETIEADHVIVTPSLGVLKAKKDSLFQPALPDDKKNFIENFGFGSVGKVYLLFDNPWWNTNENDSIGLHILWTNKDREERKNDPKKQWQLSVIGVIRVEHKPNLLCLWIVGKGSIEMERIPEDELMVQIEELLSIYKKDYNVTKPTKLLRTRWRSNDHFRGTYTYLSMDAVKNKAHNTHLAQPIPPQGKPKVQFAGEATNKNFYGTVHGAISAGWREADRLLELYGKKTPTS